MPKIYFIALGFLIQISLIFIDHALLINPQLYCTKIYKVLYTMSSLYTRLFNY